MKCNMRKNYDPLQIYFTDIQYIDVQYINIVLLCFSEPFLSRQCFSYQLTSFILELLYFKTRSKQDPLWSKFPYGETATFKIYLFIRRYRRIFAYCGFGYRRLAIRKPRRIFVYIRGKWTRKSKGIRARDIFRA